MERKFPLYELGDKVRDIRKKKKMSQVAFYQELFPEKDLEEENIKKKMNAIENGKMKRVDFELLFRLREKFDISLDYLCGFETEYPNYENKAASQYTGLSAEAIAQLHFWRIYNDKDIPEVSQEMSEKQCEKYFLESTRINEAKWILDITSKLFEKRGKKDELSGIADLSILYDIYMMSLDPPETVKGIPEAIFNSDMEYIQKIFKSEELIADTLFYSDDKGEVHKVDIGAINRQIWKERLLKDLEVFISELREFRPRTVVKRTLR